MAPFDKLTRKVSVGGKDYEYLHLADLDPAAFAKLPFSIRVLLESAVRHCDNFQARTVRRSRFFTLCG